MARMMDKDAINRSWQGKSGSHAAGSQHVASGMFPPAGGQHFPNFGCLISALYGARVRGMPPHFGLPVAVRYTDPPGYLGAAQEAFNIQGDPRNPQLKLGGLNLSRIRFEDRRSMLAQLDNLSRLASVSSESIEANDEVSDSRSPPQGWEPETRIRGSSRGASILARHVSNLGLP